MSRDSGGYLKPQGQVRDPKRPWAFPGVPGALPLVWVKWSPSLYVVPPSLRSWLIHGSVLR